ncbi:MAG: MCP four helix bundle domain-containing protein, partial [Pseudomonadota bacterium]
MTIGKKIIGGNAIVLVLLAIMAIVAFYSLDRVQVIYNRFLDVNERLVDGANELRFLAREQIARYRAILLYPDLQKQYGDQLVVNYRQFKETLERMRRLVLAKEGLDIVNEISALEAKLEQGEQRVIDLLQRGKRADALTLGIAEVRPLTQTLIEKINTLRERELKLEAEGRMDLAAQVNFFTLTMGIVLLLAVVPAVSIGFYLS